VSNTGQSRFGSVRAWWSRRSKFSKERMAIIIVGLVVVVTLLPDGDDNETAETEAASTETFTRKNWGVLNTDPEQYVGARVDIVGQVFGDVERDADGTYWQMWSDPQNSEWNTMVGYPDPELTIAGDDYVHVEGEVFDVSEGENAFGATIRAPAIRADSAEVVDATAAASPPVRTFDASSTQYQYSLAVTLEKIEYAADETRVHLEVFNLSNQEATFYSFNAKAVQGNTQFEPERFRDYPEPQSDLLPGIKTEGVIVFPPMDPNAAAKFIFEGSLSDYSLYFEPYIFDVPAG